MHSYLALSCEVDDEVRVFCGDGTGGNAGRKTESSMRKAVVGIADGADKRGDGTEIGGGLGPGSPVTDGLPVGGEGESGGGFLLIENFIEEHDLTRNFIVAEGCEFVEC